MTAQSRRATGVFPAHPLPGALSVPAEEKAPADRFVSIIAVGWVAFVAGLVAIVAGLAGAPVGFLVIGIVLLAVAGTAAVIEPAPERAVQTARHLKTLLLSGLTERGPF